MNHQPQDDGSGSTYEGTEQLMDEQAYVGRWPPAGDVQSQVATQSGEGENRQKSGGLKRRNPPIEEPALTFEMRWDKGRVHEVLMKYSGQEEGARKK